MAVPKKRTSHSRKGLRHAGQHHRITLPNTVSCPNCGGTTLRHHVCPNCGTYKKFQVLKFKEESEEGQENQESAENGSSEAPQS